MASRLLELRTDLRSLKYGFDRPSGASSNQPLIETKIPAEFDANTTGNLGEQIRNGIAPAASFLQGSLDNLVRGGLLLPSRIVQDTSRLTFFLLGFKPNSPFNPTGPAFVLKQNILSLMAPRTQTPSIFGRNRRGTLVEDRDAEYTPLPGESPLINREGQGGRLLNDLPYLPTSTIAQAAGNPIGLHIPKQGINPFNQFGDGPIPGRYYGATKNQKFSYDQDLPNQANRLFSLNEAHTMGYTIRYNRFGLNPGGEISRKIDKKNQISRRRQQGLSERESERRARLESRLNDTEITQERRLTRIGNRLNDLDREIPPYEHVPHTSNFILSYPGGPDAPFGIGVTKIRFAEGQRTFGVNSGESLIWDYSNGQGTKFRTEVRVLTKINLHDKEQEEEIGIIREDFRKQLIQSAGESGEDLQSSKVLSVSPSYKSQNIHKRLGIGDPGAHQNYKDDNRNVTRNIISAYVPLKNLRALNKITYTPVYESKYASDFGAQADLIKFRIGVVSNDSSVNQPGYTLIGRETDYVHFPAYLDSFTDTNNATWNPVNYAGRGDTFYNYGGYTRSITLGFRVVAESKPELMIMYDKLNFLISTLAPDYTDLGYPRGNLSTMTVGDYLNEMPCVINTLSYTIPPESPFEIALGEVGEIDKDVRQLPMMITVTMTITPIHDFLVSRIKNPHRDPLSGQYTTSKGFIGHIYEPGKRNKLNDTATTLTSTTSTTTTTTTSTSTPTSTGQYTPRPDNVYPD